jgi:predicted AlkP superfamily phosphohydrolase/phosphomutase
VQNRKIILIGLDGATWDQLGPAMDRGELPSLKQILERGAHGILESTVPPTTPPAWSSSQTGVGPGRHGIFDFRATPHADPLRALISLQQMKGLKLWQVLNRQGRTCGYLNVPVLYPPDPVDGYMVSGMMTPGTEVEFTHPSDLKAEILRLFPDYVLDVDIPKYDAEFWEDAKVFLDDVDHATQRRIELFTHLLETRPCDFQMMVLEATDRVGHLFWKYLDPQVPHYHAPLAERVRERYFKGILRRIDDFLGDMLARTERGYDLWLMSDHGFGGNDAYFNANWWLEQEGLLAVKKELAWKKRAFYRAWKLGENKVARTLVPKSLQRKLRTKIRKGRSSFMSDLETALDFEKTPVFYASIPCHGLFIRRKGPGAIASDEAYEQLRGRLREGLLGLRLDDGKPLVDKVWTREELYEGPMLWTAPDVVFQCRNYAIVPRPLLGATELTMDLGRAPNGFHRPDGIFAAVGEGIAARKLPRSSIEQIAPTALARMGLPKPPGWKAEAIGLADGASGA